jgi:hypothetical protein
MFVVRYQQRSISACPFELNCTSDKAMENVIVRMKLSFEELQGELFDGRRGRASRVYCTEIKRRKQKVTTRTIELKKLQTGLKEGDDTGPFES